MFLSPLEQFSIYKILPLSFGFVDLSITNSSLFVIIIFLIMFIGFNAILSNALMIPTVWQTILEMFYEFVYHNIVSENVRKNGDLYFTVLFNIFYFILFCNLLGMIPYGFTITSHIVITLGLSSLVFLVSIILGSKLTVFICYHYFYLLAHH